MFLQALRQKNIKKKTRKNLLETSELLEVDFKKEVTSVLVLIGSDEGNGMKENLSNDLKIPQENIQLLSFYTKIEKGQNIEGQFSAEDFGWFGEIKSEEVLKIINKEYDLLLNYMRNNIYLDYITSMTNTRFKVGYSDKDNRLYDIMIDVKKTNTTIFNQELKKYLNILNK